MDLEIKDNRSTLRIRMFELKFDVKFPQYTVNSILGNSGLQLGREREGNWERGKGGKGGGG